MAESPLLAHRSLHALCLVIVTVLVLFGSVTAGAAVFNPVEGSAGTAHSPADSVPGVESTQFAPDDSTALESNTTFTVEIQTNGDAHWTITERVNISTDRDRQVFGELMTEFESETADGSDLGFESFEQASELVDADTERNVSITGEERTSSVDGNFGELRLSFTWENFARTDGNRVYLDDVYETELGLWFPGLAENQELIITSPDGYGFDDANVIPEQGHLSWVGPESFTNETLQAVLIGNGGGNGPDPTPTPSPPGSSPGGIGSSLGLMALVLGGVGALGAVVAVAVMAVGTERILTLVTQQGTQEGPVADEPEGDVAAGVTSPAEDSESDIDLGLLSDEERVERLLEQNGGRMKQATIVKETGWSNAKVSQLLSSMEDEDRINKLRIGRENLISFPDENITEIGDE